MSFQAEAKIRNRHFTTTNPDKQENPRNGNDAINPARASGIKVDARERTEGPHSGDPGRSCRWLLDHIPSGLEKREAWAYRNISLGRTYAIQRGRKTCQRGHRTSRQ